MLFKYEGINESGKQIKETIDANNLKEAKAKLKVKKILYSSIKENHRQFLFKINFKKMYKINNLELSYMSRDLSIYLKAGISLVQAIKLLSQQYKNNKKFNEFFETLISLVDEGKNFYTALHKQKVFIIPEFYKQSIKVSENGGLLSSVLYELSTFLKKQDRIKKQITSAMAYPVFVLCVSVLVVGFMLGVIVPKITSIFLQMNNELPWITSVVIIFGDFISNNYISLIIFIVFVFITFSTFMKKSKAFKYFIHTILLKMPFIGKLIEMNELSRFAYMNSILINSGVPIVQTIKLSANILSNSVIHNLFTQASLKVVEGEKLSKILDTSKIYKIDTSFIHAIAIGEETSQLNTILHNLAKLYNESSKDKMTIFLALLEPIMMLIVGSIIGIIVLAMLLPIFSMNLS